MALATVFQK